MSYYLTDFGQFVLKSSQSCREDMCPKSLELVKVASQLRLQVLGFVDLEEYFNQSSIAQFQIVGVGYIISVSSPFY